MSRYAPSLTPVFPCICLSCTSHESPYTCQNMSRIFFMFRSIRLCVLILVFKALHLRSDHHHTKGIDFLAVPLPRYVDWAPGNFFSPALHGRTRIRVRSNSPVLRPEATYVCDCVPSFRVSVKTRFNSLVLSAYNSLCPLTSSLTLDRLI